MKRTFVTVFALLLIVALGCVSAWAQATAQISGIVKDQSGAVMPSETRRNELLDERESAFQDFIKQVISK